MNAFIQWLTENPETFIYFWCAMGIIGGLLVWDVGRDA